MGRVRRISCGMRNLSATRGPDRLIARIAARQHGVISRRQLVDAGLTKFAIHRRAQAGRLHRIHRGVYAVGHPGLSPEGKWMAAVLACGEGALLSHRAAGALWQLLPPPSQIDVTVSGHAGRERRDGFVVHRSKTLGPADSTIRDRIRVTSPRRTLADLRAVLPKEEFNEAVRKAELRRLPVGPLAESDRARTRLESRFLSLCRRHRLPAPEVNVQIGADEVDFLWWNRRLIVEVDGWETHRTRAAFESDRARDARLAVLGYSVLRFTWRQVTEEPGKVAATARALLAD
jgi:very-short-patch-repair endonuclease